MIKLCGFRRCSVVIWEENDYCGLHAEVGRVLEGVSVDYVVFDEAMDVRNDMLDSIALMVGDFAEREKRKEIEKWHKKRAAFIIEYERMVQGDFSKTDRSE